MASTCIITHRGLDPAKKNYFPESSREAFTDQLGRGFGIEFDVQPSMVIGHEQGHVSVGMHIMLGELLSLITQKQKPGLISALHLKHRSQDTVTLDLLLGCLKGFDLSKLLIFDVTIATAQYLREKSPELQLAFSVAHPFDIERYTDTVGGTLYSLEDTVTQRLLIDWVWLDEWDTRDKDGGSKKLYTENTFKHLRDAGLKIALVTPELHSTSLGLLGGEAHEDARDHETLMRRIREIITLVPDAVCTDYPDEVKMFL